VDQADIDAFNAAEARLAAQYDAYEPLPGQHIQGKLTLGENSADLAGLAIAYDAYHKSLGGKPAPVIDGMTGTSASSLAMRRSGGSSSARKRCVSVC
jgi:putative endopeptidase